MTEQSPAFGLRWAIKRSFVDYIRRMPDGAGWVGDGAVPVGSDEILYPPVEGGQRRAADGALERYWTFRGDVRFRGHAGMLFVQVAAPVLMLRDDAAELTVADPAATAEGARLPLVRLRLVAAPAPAGVELWSGTDVVLTEAGTELFHDVYPPGEPFEPLTVTLPVVDPG